MSTKDLTEYQKLIKQYSQERGFDEETVAEKFMLLIEEVGEFAKATRKTVGVKVSKDSRRPKMEEEAADIFYLLLDLCNMLDINLTQAFEMKQAKDAKRSWS